MRMFSRTAGSEARTRAATGIAERLKAFPETVALADELVRINSELEVGSLERQARDKTLAKIMARVEVAEYLFDQSARACGSAAEVADGGRRGPIFHEVFPDGVTPEVRPSGRSQLKPAEDLLDRFGRSKLPVIEPFRKEWLPKLQEAFAQFKLAMVDYDTASKARADAYGVEVAARKEHALAVDRIAGLVRAAFPGDREKQNVILPPSRSPRSEKPTESPEQPQTPASSPS